MRLAIVDDEPIQLEQIVEEVKSWQEARKRVVNIQTYASGEEFLDFCVSEESIVDIVLLDIKMNEVDGIEIGKRIREKFSECIIIYVTNYLNPVFESFKVGAFRYILKNNMHVAMFEALDSACKRMEEATRFFRFSSKKIDEKIALEKIMYFESNRRIIKIKTSSGDFKEFYGKLSDVEKQVPIRTFARCHQSFFVNVRYIERIEGNLIVLTDKSQIPISEKYVDIVEKALLWAER